MCLSSNLSRKGETEERPKGTLRKGPSGLRSRKRRMEVRWRQNNTLPGYIQSHRGPSGAGGKRPASGEIGKSRGRPESERTSSTRRRSARSSGPRALGSNPRREPAWVQGSNAGPGCPGASTIPLPVGKSLKGPVRLARESLTRRIRERRFRNNATIPDEKRRENENASSRLFLAFNPIDCRDSLTPSEDPGVSDCLCRQFFLSQFISKVR
jgi:hypothetical protein